MAPTALSSPSSLHHIRHVSQTLSHLARRAPADIDSITPLASVFALIVRSPDSIHKRGLDMGLATRSPILTDVLAPLTDDTLTKRQSYVLAIPTTYAGLNDGPAPGVLVGIVLGAIAGFLLIFFIILFGARAYGGRAIIEKEVIHHSHREHRDRRSRSRSTHKSEAPRRETRRETIVKERVRRETRPAPASEPDEVIVEEEEDDIVEVIEEHSPERRPTSKRTSGFRTVDPAEFGGGNAPRRKVSRR